ncbi:MAG: hypothetical protein AAFP17_16690 [Pseudomonadota bacterium]
MNRMTRRAVVATAPAALAATSIVPASGGAQNGIDYATIRKRIVLVVDTFSRSTVGFPDPMPAEEAATALSWSDAELDDYDVVGPFAQKRGVSVECLVVGDVKALIHDSRRLREREQAERHAADSDPAVIAYHQWQEIERNGLLASEAEAVVHERLGGARGDEVKA